MNIIKIPRETMLDYLDGPNVISDTITGNGRWSIYHELIFKHTDGKVYITGYSVGATESQAQSPWDCDSEVSCKEAHEIPRTGTEWVVIP